MDDITLLASGSTAETARSSLQDLIDIVSRWSIANCFCLNPIKCTTMCITPTKRKALVSAQPAMPLHLNGSALNSALTVKILGVVIISDLSWQEQARAVQSNLLFTRLDLLWAQSGKIGPNNYACQAIRHKLLPCHC